MTDKYDKYNDLTVFGAYLILKKLVEDGHGDKKLMIGYDSDCAYTGINDRHIKIEEDRVRFNEYGE